MAEWVRIGDACFNLDNAIMVTHTKGAIHICDVVGEDWKLKDAEADALWRYLTETRGDRDLDKMHRRTYVITAEDGDAAG